MKKLVFSVIIIISICSCSNNDRGHVIAPNSEFESEYIWQYIKDIDFFDKNGYEISLPESEFINELLEKSRNNLLEETDFDSLNNFMKANFDGEDYHLGARKLYKNMRTVNKAVSEMEDLSYNWDFQIFDKYEIILTLYGPGGSYEDDKGRILLFTTPDGNFKIYENPAYTVIHEIVHIAIEQSIIQKYNVPHNIKERIVDLFVITHFKELLPDYKMQDFGDSSIDEYLKTKEDFKRLPQIMGEFLRKNSI